jgi:translation initiation factor IF-3
VAIRIELIPTLSHCIETIAKREYWRSVDEYLKKRKEDKELEEKIELLKSFLETEDFGVLRRQLEKHLMNGKQVKFNLSIRNGEQAHEMTVEQTYNGKNECNRKESCN